MSINYFGSIEETTKNFARLRTTPAGEPSPMDRAKAEADAHRDTRNAAVDFLTSQRTAAGEVSHCGKSSYISGIACSDAAKALLADLFAVPMAEKGRGR